MTTVTPPTATCKLCKNARLLVFVHVHLFVHIAESPTTNRPMMNHPPLSESRKLPLPLPPLHPSPRLPIEPRQTPTDRRISTTVNAFYKARMFLDGENINDYDLHYPHSTRIRRIMADAADWVTCDTVLNHLVTIVRTYPYARKIICAFAMLGYHGETGPDASSFRYGSRNTTVAIYSFSTEIHSMPDAAIKQMLWFDIDEALTHCAQSLFHNSQQFVVTPVACEFEILL